MRRERQGEETESGTEGGREKARIRGRDGEEKSRGHEDGDEGERSGEKEREDEIDGVDRGGEAVQGSMTSCRLSIILLPTSWSRILLAR